MNLSVCVVSYGAVYHGDLLLMYIFIVIRKNWAILSTRYRSITTDMNTALSLKHFGERITLRTFLFGFIVASVIGSVYAAYQAASVTIPNETAAREYFLRSLVYIGASVVVWVMAALAGLRLRHYARRFIESPDGRALATIATGLLLLVPYSVVVTIYPTVKILFGNASSAQLVGAAGQYSAVLILLVAALYVYRGAKQLLALLPAKPSSIRWMRLWLLAGFIPFAAVCVWYFYEVAPTAIDENGLQHYSVSRGVLLLTYVLPYIVAWFLGLSACLNIASYAHRVNGVIYRPLFHGLYSGLLVVLACTFAVQLLRSMSISLKNPDPLFILVFGVIGLLVFGYRQIYYGADRLSRLEGWY